MKADLCHISGDFLAENGGILRQRVRLSRLQKLQVGVFIAHGRYFFFHVKQQQFAMMA